jgi:hypothetical protein
MSYIKFTMINYYLYIKSMEIKIIIYHKVSILMKNRIIITLFPIKLLKIGFIKHLTNEK